MTRPARVLAWIAGLLVLLLLLLAALPYLFRGRIEERAKLEANKTLDATVDWKGLGLSFFGDFPNLTVRLNDLAVTGKGKFNGDTLAAIRHLGVVIDLGSVIGNLTRGRPIVIRGIQLDHPRLALVALEDGTRNWDITKKTPEAEPKTAKPMSISLQRFDINDATVGYDDRKARLNATVKGYNQSLSGDFSQTNVAIRTKAAADTVSVTFAGIPYLNKVRLSLLADVQADLAKKAYTLKQTGLRLNDLTLAVAGSASTAGKNTNLDLAFSAPSTNFRSILSLIPAVYAHDFDKVKTTGSIAVKGKVKGEYGDSAFPSFGLEARVDNGAFQYPDLPLPARDIAMDLSLTNPGGSADSTLVNLRKFHLLLGRNPVDATLMMRTPISDPDVDARVSGKVDLADVKHTVKLEGVNELAGTVAANAAVRTRMSAVQKKQYDRVNASGSVDVAGLTVKGKALPKPLAIQQASLTLAPEKADLRTFVGTVGSSDIQASGTLQNLLSFAMRDDTLHGVATVRSNKFNLDEWKSGEGDLEVIPVPPRIDFDLDATVNQLTYGKLVMNNARGRVRIKDQRATLEDFRMNTLGGEFGLTGYYETTNPKKPSFDLGLKLTKVSIPSAFEAFTTVQALAPVAKYASGIMSTDLHLNGALGKNMLPLLPSLSGKGSFETQQVAIKNVPPLEKMFDVTKLNLLDNPTMQALKGAFQIHDGRLFTQPFAVKLGPTTLNVSGSNGFDQSIQYNVQLQVPRSELGGGANQAIGSIISKAGKAGINLAATPVIPLGIQLGGTVTDPTIKADVGSLTSSIAEGAQQAVQQAVTQKVDSAVLRLVADAEQKAAGIRQQGESLAAKVKREGYQQADSMSAKAKGPLAQLAAQPAADQLRKQSDNKAADIISEANKRADSLVAAAKRQAGQPAAPTK
jgi:hypothetical protein